jgi:3-methyladenine DNA glycosylase Tag
VTPFKSIRARAAKRKGGEQALAELLSPAPDVAALARLADDRVLAEMARRIFSAGFVWSVIESKWEGFEAAFLGFEPRRLLFQPEDFWHALTSDKRIVRNGAKIMAVRANAKFVTDIAAEHGSFGRFLAAWPVTDQVGLVEVLGKRGTRLGGNTGQYLLRFVGWDSYLLSRDVVACLRDAGLAIAETPTSKKDRQAIQAQFNAWHKQTGLSMRQLSRICALSIGQNRDIATLHRFDGQEE